MRRKNGDCLVMGGFCLYVNDEICHGLHNAYNKGVKSEPKCGRWIFTEYESCDAEYCCSECGEGVYNRTKFCSNCGASMMYKVEE